MRIIKYVEVEEENHSLWNGREIWLDATPHVSATLIVFNHVSF